MGCGKSTVASVLAAQGIPVFLADEAARKAMIENVALKKSLKDLLGSEIYNAQGHLNRSKMAELVFNNAELLQQVNQRVHPVVEGMFERWCQYFSDAPIVAKEAALLYESGSYKKLDQIWVVTCPEEIRFQRVMKRNGWSRDEIKRRLENQMPESEKVKRADVIIPNGPEDAILPHIEKALLQVKQITLNL